MATQLGPLQQSRAPLRDAIIAALRSAMETGELQPGARLVERRLCEQLGVSRTSLREALRELVAEGVIVQQGLRGLSVAEASLSEARAAYALRGAIQTLIVEQFVDRASPAQHVELKAASRALITAYKAADIDAILACKRGFYVAMCEGADNPLALGLIEKLCLRVSGPRSRALGRKARNALSILEVERIVEAVRRRDREGARQAMAEHIDSVCRWALSQTPAEEAERTAEAGPEGRRPTRLHLGLALAD